MTVPDFAPYAGRLRLVLSRRALRGVAGARVGTAAGSSLEFHDYRDYHPGDDVRLIDWNVFARSDRETIRRHREEVRNPRAGHYVFIWLCQVPVTACRVFITLCGMFCCGACVSLYLRLLGSVVAAHR